QKRNSHISVTKNERHALVAPATRDDEVPDEGENYNGFVKLRVACWSVGACDTCWSHVGRPNWKTGAFRNCNGANKGAWLARSGDRATFPRRGGEGSARSVTLHAGDVAVTPTQRLTPPNGGDRERAG